VLISDVKDSCVKYNDVYGYLLFYYSKFGSDLT